MDRSASRERLRRVRIARALPAPVMDGFDVRRFRAGREYVVDERVARYLIVAGYAIAVDRDHPKRSGH